MKTLMIAAFLTALAIAGTAPSAEPVKTPVPTPKSEPVKQAGKQISVEELGTMLEAMGYELKPFNNKDGKLIGYSTQFESEGWTIYGTFEISEDGKKIWLFGKIAPVVDESTAASVLLAMIGSSDELSPAYLTYLPKSKKFEIVLPLTNGNMNPAAIRGAISTYGKAVKHALKTWDKAVATAKEKAEMGEAPTPAKP